MRVMLLKKVPGVGKEGDTVEVAAGHAQNFLFPKHLAVPATNDVQEEHAAVAAAERALAERELHALQRLAAALDGYELVMHVAANAEGTLYGAVTSVRIGEALIVSGKVVQASWVILPEPIKALGEYDARIEMPHGLEASIRVIVEAES